MSVRVDKIESDILSSFDRSIQPAGWRRGEQHPARQEPAVRDAAKLLNEYGKDAYWLACLCERRSDGELGRQWHAIVMEIERRTGRRSFATPGKTSGSLRAALDQLHVPPEADLPRLDAYHAGAPDLYEEHSHPHGRDRHASQVAARKFDWQQEDCVESASAARVAYDRADNSARGAAMRPHNEEIYDSPPRKRRRRGFVTALVLIGCTTIGAYAYRTYYVAPRSTQASAVPAQAAPTPAAVRSYVVQISARRSEADVQASFRSLQSKFPRQLGGRTAIVQRADLGTKGIYYRAVVGPFASVGAADQLCSSLKAAGGQCTVQRD
jgi:hypothetical protein